MKRAAEGGEASKDRLEPVIDLTLDDSSQDSDQGPEIKKAKLEIKTGIKNAFGDNHLSHHQPSKPKSSFQRNRSKQARGFTAENGFHARSSTSQVWAPWGASGNSNQRSEQFYNHAKVSANPPSLLSINTGVNWGRSTFPDADVFSHPSDQFRVKLSPNPEDFYQVVEKLSCPVDVQYAITNAGQYTCLTRDIAQCFNRQQQESTTMKQKILLWKEIYRALRTEFDSGLFVFGSTFNGFGGSGCDIDMCLFPNGASLGDKQWLTTVRRLLQKHCRHFIRGGIELVNAKVPILKFFDREGGLEVDLSVNNPTSIRNTHLLYCYSQCDYRVRPLVLAVKMWAKDHGINEARFQTLSSYTITLMVIHYLQSGVNPPVVPCLHRLNPQVFNHNSNIFHLQYNFDPVTSENKMSLGELLIGFFKYYTDRGKFDTHRDVGSIRCGSTLNALDCEDFARMNKLAPGQWKAHLLMEEPFDRTNAARAVCNAERWRRVRATFEATNNRFQKSNVKVFTLHDISSKKIRLC